MPPLELPIFPLGVVLFPGAPQLLHIFEPRYRQMLADCLEGTRRFGISYVKTGDDASDPAPVPGAVGCSAIVRESRLLPDGRSNILAEGDQRYVLLDYLQTDLPYRVARVEPFDDEDDAGAPQSVEAATELRGLFARFAADMGTLSDRGAAPLELARDPRRLSFQVSAGLEVGPEVKVQLLGMRSTLRRLSHLNRILRPLNAELERRVDVHVRARTNGRGGATRDIVKGP
jgi:Lon protease-like protein